jgi:hypothetical protein
LIRHSYAARIFNRWLNGNAAAAHFEQCARLANSVSICWLKRPRDLTTLTDVARLIEAHVESSGVACSLS